jgi:hypothetical protein
MGRWTGKITGDRAAARDSGAHNRLTVGRHLMSSAS